MEMIIILYLMDIILYLLICIFIVQKLKAALFLRKYCKRQFKKICKFHVNLVIKV